MSATEHAKFFLTPLCKRPRTQRASEAIYSHGHRGLAQPAAVQFAGGRLSVRPGKPAVVDGYDSGLAAGKKAEVRSGAVVTLGSAAAGGGGGTYRIPVGLELSGPQTPSAVTVTLVPQVAGS
jgi:hypothetical protein